GGVRQEFEPYSRDAHLCGSFYGGSVRSFLSRMTSSARSRQAVFHRVAAKLLDLFLVIAVAAVLPRVIGPLVGFLYSILSDGLNFGPFQGQSFGKKIFGLQVINLKTRAPASARDSVIRNSPVGFATFFAIIPIWGWLILILVGLPLMIMEIYLIVRVESGHRLGDVMADTEVRPAEKLSR